MHQAGEGESLHHVLRKLSQTYVLCRECFTQGHYPKSVSAFDFEAQSIESILKASELGLKYKVAGDAIVYGKDGEERQMQVEVEWPQDDKERLIEAVSNMNDDWDEISKSVFNGDYSPEECAL